MHEHDDPAFLMFRRVGRWTLMILFLLAAGGVIPARQFHTGGPQHGHARLR